MANINGTDAEHLAGAQAAAKQAYAGAQAYQDQGRGTPVPAADTHPLVPDGVNGRYPA